MTVSVDKFNDVKNLTMLRRACSCDHLKRVYLPLLPCTFASAPKMSLGPHRYASHDIVQTHRHPIYHHENHPFCPLSFLAFAAIFASSSAIFAIVMSRLYSITRFSLKYLICVADSQYSFPSRS